MKHPTFEDFHLAFPHIEVRLLGVLPVLCRAVDKPHTLAPLVEKLLPKTHSELQRLQGDPYSTPEWRRRVILHAANEILGPDHLQLVDDELRICHEHTPTYLPASR